jgi:hypothetical protein
VRPGYVVVAHVLAQHVLEVPRPQNQQPIQEVAAHRPHPALGDRVRLRCPRWRADHSDGLTGEHGVERGRELGVAIAEELRRPPARRLQRPRQVARLLGHPGGRRVRGATGEEDAARLHLQEEQNEDHLQADGLHDEEVARQQPGGVRPQEGGPGQPRPPRGRWHTVAAQHALDGRGRDAMPQREELAPQALVAPAGTLPGKAQDQRLELRRQRGPAGAAGAAAPKAAHARRTSARCQRSSVSGRTGTRARSARGRQRLRAAGTSRSVGRRRVRLSCRRRTRFSCRSTSSSTSCVRVAVTPRRCRRRAARRARRRYSAGSQRGRSG